MPSPKLSIIIPVYNAEAYLAECLDSIINQTLKDMEVICVNDGSTDNSLDILKEYAAKDNRIVIIDKENGGQGLARNIAIEKAMGEYIGFVDSDDWIDINMFQLLYDSAKAFNTDISVCEYQHYYQDKKEIAQPDWTKIPFDKKFDNRAFQWSDVIESFFLINFSPWDKIYRRDFIIQNKIKFAEGIYYEDAIFVFKGIIYANAISYIRKPLYTYRYSRPGSTMADNGKKHFDIFIVIQMMQNTITESSNVVQLRKVFVEYKFKQYLYHYNKVKRKYQKEFWEKIIAEYELMHIDEKAQLNKKNYWLMIGINYGIGYYKLARHFTPVRAFLFNYVIVGKFKNLLIKILKK